MQARGKVERAAAWFVAGVVATLGVTGTAVAATGGTFILGKSNSASTTTTLTNSAGTALSIVSRAGTSPFKVSNSVKVSRLNADLVDGVSAEALQRRVSGACPSGQGIIRVNANGTVGCAAIPQNVQTRVTGTCATGEAVRSVAADGTVTCESIPQNTQARVTGTCPSGQAIGTVTAEGSVTCLTMPTVFSAVVPAEGGLTRTTGAGGMISTAKPGTGYYIVFFPVDVRACTYSATPGLDSGVGVQPAAFTAVKSYVNEPKGVFVFTYDSTGTLADQPFHLVVVC